MQSLLPLSAASTSPPLSTDPGVAGQNLAGTASAGTASSAPSANVTITDAESNRLNQIYDSVGALSASTPVWEQNSSDSISSLMAVNYDAATQADRFHGLGAALLQRFLVSGDDYSQSIMLRTPGSGTGSLSNLDQIRQTQLHTVADNQVTLDVQTADGATVHLSLTSQSGGLGVQIEVTKGSLSATDRKALAGLADAFQGAIDGLTSVPPRLALDGLTQFDPNVLSSVNLHASLSQADGSVQTLDFQADSQQRSIAYVGAAGTLNVNVDLSDPALIGSAQQQAQALAGYLQQFDEAQTRGRGNADLMAMFKDAFTTLNSNYNVDQKNSVAKNGIPLGDADHAMLSGLADFNASVQATDRSPNPMQPQELDTFSYQVSQQTTVQGSRVGDRSIQQSQQSHLSASYHQAVYADTPLDLSGGKYAQNYYYDQIDDTASSVASIGYQNGRLVKASVTQSANQSTHIQKYLVGELQEDTTTPSSVSRTWDLLDLLQSAKPKEDGTATADDRARWRNTLSSISDLVLMKSDPTQLRTEQLTGAKEQKAA
jgi:hypothetical protein